MRRFLVFILFPLLSIPAICQDNQLWMRYTAISPDGKTILFCYKGDIWSVPSTGGTAVPVTLTESYEYSPVWSHDGKSIAFASDRNGNFDVFVMAATGGEARRLTFSSAKEIPWSFTANNKDVIFSACRQDVVTNAQFPISLMSELYTVPVSGGKVSMLLSTPALQVCPTSAGDKILYEDIKGYENEWRKHHTSAIARDIWLYDFNTKKYTRLTQFNGEDRNPVFDANNQDFYYLSEQSGSFNVFKSAISDPSKPVALTRFTKHPVRFLSRSDNNTLCFTYDGEIYTLRPGGDPVKVPVKVMADGRSAQDRIVPVNDAFTEMRLSANGKEYAYIFRGEIFVSSIDGGFTKRITA